MRAWCVDTVADVSLGRNDFGVRIRHGRQRTQMLRPPTILESEHVRLCDETINGKRRPSILLGDGSPWSLRESFGKALDAACMTAIIPGPRYGSTVGASLVICANSRVWATQPNLACEDNTRRPTDYAADGKKNLHISKASANKNPDKFSSSWEYSSALRVMPSAHDNATLGAVPEQWQVLPALFAARREPQVPSRSSEHDSVNFPAPGYPNQGHRHCLALSTPAQRPEK
jgi:hypothetical protein